MAYFPPCSRRIQANSPTSSYKIVTAYNISWKEYLFQKLYLLTINCSSVFGLKSVGGTILNFCNSCCFSTLSNGIRLLCTWVSWLSANFQLTQTTICFLLGITAYYGRRINIYFRLNENKLSINCIFHQFGRSEPTHEEYQHLLRPTQI